MVMMTIMIVVMRGKEMITASENWHLDLMRRRKEESDDDDDNNKIKSENRFFES